MDNISNAIVMLNQEKSITQANQARMMNGCVRFESKIDHGTVSFFEFDREMTVEQESATISDVDPAFNEPPDLKGITIVVADDNYAVQLLL